MITQISIRNFKSIKEANLRCNGVNIIIGANNSGKSNILESLEYYSRSLTVPLEELFGPGPFSFSQILHRGSDVNKEGIEIDIAFHGKYGGILTLTGWILYAIPKERIPTFALRSITSLWSPQIITLNVITRTTC